METKISIIQQEAVSTNEVEKLKEMIDQLNSRVDDLENQIKGTPTQCNEDPKQIDQLNYLSSLQRRNDLVIQGIPQLPNENEETLKLTIVKLANSCGSSIEQRQIKKVHRMSRKAKPH